MSRLCCDGMHDINLPFLPVNEMALQIKFFKHYVHSVIDKDAHNYTVSK